ncbi:hypothetical protein GCM10027456_82150 [Kineosporia babensis]
MLVCCLSLGAGGAALAASGNRTSTTALASVQQTTRTYAHGPTADVETGPMDGVGMYGKVDPFPVTVPTDAAAYDALVTITFRYRTKGRGPFTLDLSAGTRADAHDLTTRPSVPWPLAPSTATDSSSVQFVVPALKAGKTYFFAPTADTGTPRGVGSSRLSTSGVVLTVQLTPRTT